MAIEWNGDRVLEKVRQGLISGVFRGTESVRNEAVRLILDTSKSGHVYRRRDVYHQASAPGEPPASNTGFLAANIDTSYDEGGLVGIVTAHAAYAAYLEFGTIKMEPRPFMRPALDNKRDEIIEGINDEVRRALA